MCVCGRVWRWEAPRPAAPRGDLNLDLACEDGPAALTRREAAVFSVLKRRQGEWVPQLGLFLEAWQYPSVSPDGDRHLVRVTVYRLRKKLRGTKWVVESLRGRGRYRLVDGEERCYAAE